MTGEATLAYQHEPVDDYGGTPTMSEYLVPGLNPTIEDLTLENALIRMGLPSDADTIASVAGNFEGAIGVSGTVTEAWWLNHVYGAPPTAGGESSAPYTYTWSPRLGRAQSSRWYIGVDALDGVVERVIKGAVFPQCQLSISVGEEVTFSLTGFYGDETENTTLTPGTLTGKDSDAVVFHGGSLEIPNSTSILKPQQGTLNIQTNARAQRGWQRKPLDAVMGSHEPTLTLDKILTGSSMASLAYGNSQAPATSVTGAATGTLRFESGGQAALEAQMTRVTPNSYAWDQVENRDEDVLENLEFNVDSLSMVQESAASSAL